MQRQTTIVIGVDPGKTTGIAIFMGDQLREACQLPRTEVIPYLRGYLEVTTKQVRNPYVVIAMERFQIGQQTIRSSRQTDAPDVIGALTELAVEFDARILKQNPGDAKRMGNPARLKALEWWQPGQDHANDAMAHMLLGLATVRPQAFASVIGV